MAGDMAIRKLVLMVALTWLAMPGFAIADPEHRATVLTRSGERVSGVLEDVENGTVYVRVSLNDQRRIPIGETLVIDFVGGAQGLPDTELSVAARPEHLVMLRNGSHWQGQFVDIRGGEANTSPDEPHTLIFRVGGEERRIGLNQVGRIYFGNYPFNTSANQPAKNIPAGAIRVPGNAAWVPTNIVVRRGDRLAFNASGQVRLSQESDVATPAGSTQGRRTAGAPLPSALAGALIGKIGNSAPFAIPDGATIPMATGGELFLGINDDHVNDNGGEFQVQVQLVGTTRR
jgi:hypothetical protein